MKLEARWTLHYHRKKSTLITVGTRCFGFQHKIQLLGVIFI